MFIIIIFKILIMLPIIVRKNDLVLKSIHTNQR